jgi:hypothetical protein
MGKPVAQWTDARLDDLAAALAPVPAEVAALRASVDHLNHLGAELEPLPLRLAVLTAAVDRLGDENRELRADLAAMQRQLLTVAWGLVAALIGAAAALATALL